MKLCFILFFIFIVFTHCSQEASRNTELRSIFERTTESVAKIEALIGLQIASLDRQILALDKTFKSELTLITKDLSRTEKNLNDKIVKIQAQQQRQFLEFKDLQLFLKYKEKKIISDLIAQTNKIDLCLRAIDRLESNYRAHQSKISAQEQRLLKLENGMLRFNTLFDRGTRV